MKNIIKHIIVLSGILLLMGCHDGIFYTQYKAPSTKGWYKKRALTFDMPKVESQSNYNVRIGIRVWENFEYRNIVLIARLYEDKKVVSVDTLSYELFDNANDATGKGVGIKEYSKLLTHQYVLKPKHKYKVKINHHMLHNPVTRVSDVGVSLEN